MASVGGAIEYLCLACRRSGHQTARCPERRTSKQPLEIYERQNESSLCERCRTFDILSIIDADAVRDELEHWHFIRGFNKGKSSWDPGWKEHYENQRFALGPAPVLVLRANCPLCRLIFAIFPRDVKAWNIIENPEPWFLRPYPPYDRTGRWGADVSLDVRKRYAVYFTVEQEHGEWRQRLESSTGPTQGASLAFAASSGNVGLRRKALCVREVNQKVNYQLLRSWIERCQSTHEVACRKAWDSRILSCRMIDVETRTVVACPEGCDYVALSYVWGGVQPEKGALENDTLPQTIEDAITATKGIGKRYLWVDALCVDQTPTAQQKQQLGMMDMIYAYSSVTIVALSGLNSADGLPGVGSINDSRKQAKESIDGIHYLSVGQTSATLLNQSTYFTRAWTMQEILFSKCRLIFTERGVHFMCNRASLCEDIDESYDPASYIEYAEPREFWLQKNDSGQPYSPDERRRLADDDYRQMVENYTQRKMTNDIDSLNAFLGIQNYLVSSWKMKNFRHGLPLQDFPQALRWYHDRSVKTPRRRAHFPSWSWTGWEGSVVYDRALDAALASDDGDISTDMIVEFVRADGDSHAITLQGMLVKLNILTEPFSEAYTIDGRSLLGVLRERNFLHNNTLPSGEYEFLVVERMYTKGFGNTARQAVDMLLLDWKGDVAERKTFVRLTLEKGLDFGLASPKLSRVYLQ